MTRQDTTSLAILPVLFELRHERGLWTVTRDYTYFGRYDAQASALDAVEAAVAVVEADGGTAQIISKSSVMP